MVRSPRATLAPMHDQGLTRMLICVGSGLIGLAFLAYAGWARAGRSAAARRWMGNEFGSFDRAEHMALLGAPALGVICLCVCASTAPGVGRYAAWIAVPVAVLAVIPLLWAVCTFLPVPAALYPAWARTLRARNRRAERAAKDWLRGR